MKKYSELDSVWSVDEERTCFLPPVVAGQDYQRLVFDEVFRDGAISATLTFQKTTRPETEERPDALFESRVGALIFRFQNKQNYYFAGLGAYGNKFFISKMVEGQGEPIASTGSSRAINLDEPYEIEIRCSGNRISLSHNNVTHLQVFDNTFHSGQWGLQTWRSSLDFRKITNHTIKPKCFVIMPFATEFNEVFEVIKQTVKDHQYECIRADERYLVGPIMDDVNDQIENADLIVADLTGRNPNVYYEVGYAAALRKSVIQIAQSASDLPFDVRHLRTFSYSTRILGDRQLAHDLGEAIRAIA